VSRRVRGPLGAPLALLAAAAAHAQPPAADTTTRVTFGGFIDGYFAYDFNRPRTLDRPYTTQAARHGEFNVNLAHLEATLSGPRLRGRVAAQFGTSVQANYAAEPTVGTLSGASVSRFVQEAVAGYRVARALWVDAGVFFSPFGSESWISRDNWTYTRSLIADESPYYEAGVKATWQPRAELTAQLHLINGWQNVSETNGDKAVGARVDWTPREGVEVAYDAFVGNEQPDSVAARLRVWQEAIVQLRPTARLGLRATFDYGVQRRAGSGLASWRGWAVLARWAAAPRVAVAARWEGYADPEQVIVATGQPFGLRLAGGSLGVDVAPAPRLLWRVEARALRGRDPLFPRGAESTPSRRGDAAVVTSLALTF
jgi:hypothetical protein